MKISNYAIFSPWKGVCKKYSIMARGSEKHNGYFPLVYLQRPKWIKDDAAWDKICNSIQLKLPRGFEID